MRHARRDVLAFAAADAGGFLAHSRSFRASTSGVPEAAFPALWPLSFLLPSDGFRWTLASARIGVGALPADRKAATVTQPAVAPEVHESFDIHRHFAPQITLDHIITVDHLTNLQHFLIRELGHPTRFWDAHFA